MIKQSSNPNHPRKGSKIRVSPIINKRLIKRIKHNLTDMPRDLALFVMGINTALRASDLLGLKTDQVQHLSVGDSLVVHERKTKKNRRITINHAAHKVLRTWLEQNSSEWLFPSQRREKVLSVQALNVLVKKWCEAVHIESGIKQNGTNYGSHTLRKTFGYWQRIDAGVPIHTLMKIFNHSSQGITLTYLGIQEEEIEEVYMNYEL
ncbi:MAG: tyrosine-type recombinase/integrase [Candidatus Parabeggiatoa sp.]|nr:tyrosine-type recombinase/integrase [Candidatus Parabeggiatoa sp.]